jgi:hypothetical protein
MKKGRSSGGPSGGAGCSPPQSSRADVITTSVFGLASGDPSAVPAAAILSRTPMSFATTWPKTVAKDGFDEAKVRTVGENAQTLKFDQSGFEDE